MSSIPLPALSVRPPEQPDILGQMSKLQALRNMGQQNQENSLEIQQKQQAMKDQQAMTAAMHNWDGKDLEELPSLILKNGGSANAVFSVKQQIIGQKEKLSQMAKDDAETGAKNLETAAKKNDMLLGKLQNVTDGPSLLKAAQDAVTEGLLDPQHAQVAQQLAQLPPDQFKQSLAMFEKSLQAQSVQFAQAQKERETATAEKNSNTTAARLQAEMPGGPLESVDKAAMQDWLQKNPGKGPSDFTAWKAKQAPSAVIMNNQLGQGGEGTPLRQAAQRYLQSGELPSGFARSPGTITAILKEANAIDPNASIAGNKAIFNANKNALGQLQTQFSKVTAFENTAIKNLDQVVTVGKDIPDLGARFANVPVRAVSEKMIGTQNMAKFKAALLTAQTETAKVLNSATGSGVLSDSARKELEEMLSGNLPYPSMVAAINQLKTDMGNRHQSYQDEINNLQNVVSGKPQGDNSQQSDPFSQFGGKTR